MRIGVDSGGTFTDFIAVDDGQLVQLKLPSTPGDPAAAVVAGVAQLGGADEVVHGTTVATNALLTRTGGPAALITTRGFEDVLVLRRQERPRLYALHPAVEPPLVPEELRFGLGERLGAGGVVIVPLDPDDLERVLAAVRSSGARSVAVVLLHSYANDAHERQVGMALASSGLPISLSCDVMPMPREYERTATTVADAYVAPLVAEYLGRLLASLHSFTPARRPGDSPRNPAPGGPASREAVSPRLRVMQSSGGAAAAAEAVRRPVNTLLSGPAAGVIGARAVAARAGFARLITFDMGGTSTDVALLDERGVELVHDGEVAGLPIGVPQLRVHTVGAGGGSIAFADGGGALRVGPGSAGAAPGPACYGRGGTLATVTDAALVEGRLDPERFLDGAMRLDRAAAERVIGALAAELGLSLAEAAAGVRRVACAVMARAIRVVSVERGHDPRDFVLVAFGGAGPMFACDLADELGVARVLVPPAPGLLCAYGALCAEVARDYVATRIVACASSAAAGGLAAELAPLFARATADLADEQVAAVDRRCTARVDLRYVGQSYELSIALPGEFPGEPTGAPATGGAGFDYVAAFHEAHERRFGFADRSRAVERVTLRVEARGKCAPPPPLTVAFAAGEARLADTTWSRGRLLPGTMLDGPALIVEYSATTYVAAGWRAQVGGDGELLLERVDRIESTEVGVR